MVAAVTSDHGLQLLRVSSVAGQSRPTLSPISTHDWLHVPGRRDESRIAVAPPIAGDPDGGNWCVVAGNCYGEVELHEIPPPAMTSTITTTITTTTTTTTTTIATSSRPPSPQATVADERAQAPHAVRCGIDEKKRQTQ